MSAYRPNDVAYAHTLPGKPPSEWEPLEKHLTDVAEVAAEFVTAFAPRAWGQTVGLWHDLGKYSKDFQEYIRLTRSVDPRSESVRGRVDHATAGAQHAAGRFPGTAGRLLAYCIAGHHGGLPDNEDLQGGTSGLTARLKKRVPDYSAAPLELRNRPVPPKPDHDLDKTNKSNAAFQLSVYCRMLFSCLVDADYLATEAFMRPGRVEERRQPLPTLRELKPLLDTYLERFTADSPVNRARAGVLAQCRANAELSPGFFSLTVPTGGGKTLSSLAFALSHAVRHGLHRVIYAIPFTSIIEQNAAVFAEALKDAGAHGVLEHHSNFDPPDDRGQDLDLEAETPWYRLAAENWDAPIVVTTNVQLFESLFASKPSRCRKLHRIARSVIVLDECQALPVTLLAPTLRMLEELVRNYGCTVVLCTATQPAVTERPGFHIGIKGVREIVDDPPRLFETLKRVDVERLGKLDDSALVQRLAGHEQALCVVNTRAHAAKLFSAVRDTPNARDGLFHLSASMCAAHRTDVLDEIRERLDPNATRPCIVVSTQLIEAGVDIDCPVVYRAMTGLDSLAQAAGRCNREGRLHRGRVFVFDTDVDPRGELRLRRQVGDEVAGLYDDLLGLDAIQHFFRQHYWTRGECDGKQILKLFSLSRDGPHFQFRECADQYRLIDDVQHPIIVPYDDHARALIDELRNRHEPSSPGLSRRAQRYVVSVYDWQLAELVRNHAVTQYHERFWVLENESNYDQRVGLRLDAAAFQPEKFLV